MCPEERDKLQDTEVTGTVREHAERNLLRKTATEEQWGASLVVQGLQIHRPVQGTWVQSLVRELSRGAT